MAVDAIVSFEFSVKPNTHAVARMKVLLKDTGETTDVILERMHGEEIKIVEILYDGNEDFPPLFAGIISSCKISHMGGNREVDLVAASGSIHLDIIKKSLSYQDTEMSYKEIISNLLNYTQNSALLYFEENKILERPVIQYQETDFSFAVRLASHQNTCIYPDITNSMPRLTYGLPKGRDRGEITTNCYQMGMDSRLNKKTDKKEALLFYEITCGDNYHIGETLWLNQKRLKVCSKKGTLEKGLIHFCYILATDLWYYHPFHMEKRRMK